MASRTDLHNALYEKFGVANRYFQPPESLKLKYPCFIYSLSGDDTSRADNLQYRRVPKYDLTYITYDPDDELIHEIEGGFLMCRFDRHFTSDDLNHYHYILYWS